MIYFYSVFTQKQQNCNIFVGILALNKCKREFQISKSERKLDNGLYDRFM